MNDFKCASNIEHPTPNIEPDCNAMFFCRDGHEGGRSKFNRKC